jgi:hypothetical protein
MEGTKRNKLYVPSSFVCSQLDEILLGLDSYLLSCRFDDRTYPRQTWLSLSLRAMSLLTLTSGLYCNYYCQVHCLTGCDATWLRICMHRDKDDSIETEVSRVLEFPSPTFRHNVVSVPTLCIAWTAIHLSLPSQGRECGSDK